MTTVPVADATVTDSVDICLTTHASINGQLLVIVDPNTETLDRPVVLSTQHALSVFSGAYDAYDPHAFSESLPDIELAEHIHNVTIKVYFRHTLDDSVVNIFGDSETDSIRLTCQNEEIVRLCDRFGVSVPGTPRYVP